MYKDFTINDIPAKVVRVLQNRGMTKFYQLSQAAAEKFCQEWQRCCMAMDEALPFFQIALEGLYMYQLAGSSGDYSFALGMTTYNDSGTAVIGFCGEYITIATPEQLDIAIMHELCHLSAPETGHDPEYHALLDQMIANFNHIYNTELINDYAGMDSAVLGLGV